MWPRQTTVSKLLHRFVFNVDPFLFDLRRVPCPAFRWPHIRNAQRNRVCTDATATDSSAADLILSTAFGSAQN
jgi:hypothetical protein